MAAGIFGLVVVAGGKMMGWKGGLYEVGGVLACTGRYLMWKGRFGARGELEVMGR